HPSPGATADAKAWERLWARSRLVLHAGGQALTCSLSAPCDLPAELVPCWQPEPAGPCQALPGLQQPAAVGQVSGAPWGAKDPGGTQMALTEHPFHPQGLQEFGGLQLHPNLCVQVWSSGQVRLTQCLRDREYCWALPGRTDDLLLLERREHGGNASLCALERGTCTPLASFASTGAGHPGLLEQELRRDVAAGQCRQVSAGSRRAAGEDRAASDMSLSPSPQVWQHKNSTGVMLWACPLHKYLRAHWALAWMGVLLGAACLLLLLLLKKEDVKGERCPPGESAWPGTPPQDPASPPLLPAGWLKSLRADYGSEGE
ncbi:I17RC protein, partial [Anhinga anhinga]|nr:I17RC protein [Anhinga anhinga]